MPSLRRVMEPTWTYDSLTTLTGGHTPPQLGQRGGWNGVRHGHRGIITHHKWPQVFRVTAVLDKSDNMMNVEKVGANGYASDSTLLPATSYAPGAVPSDLTQRENLLLRERDTTIPKQQIHWNWVVDLPFGRGQTVGGHMNKWLDAVVGGWQVTGMGTWSTNYFTIPTTYYPTGAKIQYYGHKYPVQDCTSGKCLPGYLLWNAYIPAQYINSVNAKTGLPNGIEGVPANYQSEERRV